MTALVTGGAGFIGSHLCDALLAAGESVRVVDDLSTGHVENLPDGVELLQGDLADPDLAATACSGVKTAFHLAARPSVPWSVAHPERARRANLETTESLVAALAEAGGRRIVFSSSSAVYGDAPGLPKTESMEPAPMSPYAEHKLRSEQVLESCGLESVSLRYFNVFGPRQDPSSPYSGVISIFARCLSEGKVPTLYGDGSATRDFVFVADVVAANLAAAQTPLDGPLVANIACGGRITVLALWQTMAKLAGKEGLEPNYGPPRKGDILHSTASIAVAAERLGYAPVVPFEEGLRRTLGDEARA